MFCEIGPLTCFISRHCIPPDMEFDGLSVPPSYRTADESLVIRPGDDVRVKLIGIRVDHNDLFACGTLMDDYLGLCATD